MAAVGSDCPLITLEIGGLELKCDRYDLMENSDYFKAMFQDGFAESSKTVIALQGVELEAVKTILKIIWDHEHIVQIEAENLFSVLQASCMLQFLAVKELVIERMETTLDIYNCLQIWFNTEPLQVHSLCYKAKSMALMEFKTIKQLPCFLTMGLEDLIIYLSNVNLYCTDEIDVYEAVNAWYCHNGAKSVSVLYRLLRCVCFVSCLKPVVSEMLARYFITREGDVRRILESIDAIKSSKDLSQMNQRCVNHAWTLLGIKERNLGGFPCVFVQNVKQVREDSDYYTPVFYYDNFKRKRKYGVLNEKPVSDFNVYYIDTRTYALKELFYIENDKIDNLGGYKILGYKHLVFLFGGQFHIGSSNRWSRDFHIYDVIRKTWTTLQMPFKRRHFSACVVGNLLYIIGGTGPMRVLQNNLFFYNIKTGEWSDEVNLPHCEAHLQLQCCRFQNRLFILDTINDCGYTLTDGTKWNRYQINDPLKTLPTYSNQWTVFSYHNSLYIKDAQLYELVLLEDQFHVAKVTPLPESVNAESVSPVESVLCNNALYCLSRHEAQKANNPHQYSLETFDLNFSAGINIKRNSQIFSNGDVFKRNTMVKLFGVFHPHLIDENESIL